MSEGEIAAMDAKICQVCGLKYESGDTLLQTRFSKNKDGTLKGRFNEKSVTTGWGLCNECEKFKNEDYIAMVVVKHDSSDKQILNLEDADRTGEIIRIRRHVFKELFHRVPDKIEHMLFLDEEAAIKIKELMPKEGESNESSS